MKNKILLLLLIFSTAICSSQNQNENVLYVVDSIPIIEEPKEGFGTLDLYIIPKGIIIQAKDYVGKILKFELKNTGIAIATASIFNDKI